MSYRGDGPPPPAHPTTDPWTGANYQAYAPSYGYHYGATPAYGYDPRYYGPPPPPGTAPAHYYHGDRSHAGRSRSRSAPRQRADSNDPQTRKETSKSYKYSSAKSSSRSRSRSREKRYFTKYERSDSSNTSHSRRSRSHSRDSPRRSASRDSRSVESEEYPKNKKVMKLHTPKRIRKHKESKKCRKSPSPDDRILLTKIKQEKRSGKAHHSKRSSVTPPRTYQGRDSSITPPKSYMKRRSLSNSSHESRSRAKHKRSHSTSHSRSGTPKQRTTLSSSSSSSRSASEHSSSSSRSKSRSVSPKRKRRHHSGSSNRSQSRSSHRRHKSRSRSAHSGSRSGSNSSSEDARRGQFTVADRKRYWKMHKTRQELKPVEPTKEIKPPPGAVDTATAEDVMYGDPPEMEGPNFAELLTYDSAGMPSTSKGKPPIPIRNDGSFLEMFKKMQETTKKETEEQKPVIKKPMLPFIGKRRGGKVLKTGLVKKARAIDEQPADDKPKDAWSLYMQEVKKYRETSCEEERKTRPLVK